MCHISCHCAVVRKGCSSSVPPVGGRICLNISSAPVHSVSLTTDTLNIRIWLVRISLCDVTGPGNPQDNMSLFLCPLHQGQIEKNKEFKGPTPSCVVL